VRPQWRGRMRGFRQCTAAAFMLFVPSVGQSARLTLQSGLHGYFGATDTWLSEGQKEANYGADTNLFVRYDANDGGYNEDCALLRFGLPEVMCDSLTSATLEIFYLLAGSMQADNAMAIKPYRVAANRPWFENNRNGGTGQGANWRYFGRDQVESNKWTFESGGWYDKIDDGNSTNWVKRTGGSVAGAIPPTNWVAFDVRCSVTNWLSGTTNNGFILFSCGFRGGGTEVYAGFASREYAVAALRPRLQLEYRGARIEWNGGTDNIWNTTATNWLAGGYPCCYQDSDHVFFGNSSTVTSIWIAPGMSPASVAVSNQTRTYTLYGSGWGGTGTLWKGGGGQLRLAVSNWYSGASVIAAGTVSVLTNGALGTPSSGTSISNEAALVLGAPYVAPESLELAGSLVATSALSSWTGPITLKGIAQLVASNESALRLDGELRGDGTAVIRGGGLIALYGPMNYSGNILVTGATLVVNSVVTSGSTAEVTIFSGGLLSGTGLVAGAVVVAGGGCLEPGVDGQGLLTVAGNVTVADGGSLVFTSHTNKLELTQAGRLMLATGAMLQVVGTLTGSSAVPLVSGAAEVAGTFAALPDGAPLPSPNNLWHIHYQPNAVYLGRNERPIWYFRALREESGALLSWWTPVEIGVVGFDVFREDGGGWQKINATLIPARYPGGGVYTLSDPGAPFQARYRLVQWLENNASNELAVVDRSITELKIITVEPLGDSHLRLRWQSREDESYWIEQTKALSNAFQPYWGPLPATPAENTFTLSTEGTSRFYRVVLPP